jgi:orotate phosphoribosyltransferase
MAVLTNEEMKLTVKLLGENIKRDGLIKSDTLIRLANGKPTNFYFNIKKVFGNPDFLLNLAAVYFSQFRKFKIRSVGGIESGSIPLAYLYSFYSYAEGIHVSSFYVKKQKKDHGLNNITEGIVRSPCIIFEDVITTGGSVIKAITLLKRANPELEILGIATVIDRTDDDCANVRKYTGLEVSSLFKYKSLLPKF